MPTATQQVTITNADGMHARPVMKFVDAANRYQATIHVARTDDEAFVVDGKSVMQMLTLAATCGTTLRIEADGDDADAAIVELIKLFEDKFGED